VQHGHHVTKLQMDTQPRSFTWTQLPCQQLQELWMCGGSLQLAPNNNNRTQPGVLQCCTGLTKLCLFHVTVLDGAAGLAALAGLPRLQHLELHAERDTELLIPNTALGVLTGLKGLAMSGVLDTKVLMPLSGLCDLQELTISFSSVALVLEELPGFTQLASLRSFSLWRAGTLDPALLHSCTNMQRLILDSVSIRPAGNPNALLELLGRLQGLQHLELRGLNHDWPLASAAYTALAGGSKLQHLALMECSLPADVWQMVFPEGRHLPQLTEFSVCRMPQPAMLSADGVSSLAGCCSGLCCLTVELQPGVQLPNNLSSLSSLTKLQMSVVSRGAFFSSLVTLQSLENLSELYAVFEEPLPPLELVCLTCLRRLTVLEFTYGDVEDEDVFWLYQQVRCLGLSVVLSTGSACGLIDHGLLLPAVRGVNVQ